jgi:hypothetical protein
MFQLFDTKTNYSTALRTCSEIGGNLAHILSESRSNLISEMLGKLTNISAEEKEAYVGLNETTHNHFMSSIGEPIKCFQFRAWAPRQPK